jgi:neutral ceramidase
MTVLRFRQGSNDVGVISWFATHGVSMTPSNHLISPDNKGYAEWRWEHELKGVRYNADSDFVAAFAQSNAGDMTPNLNLDGTGPTNNEFDNTRIIGERQLQKALEIYNGSLESLSGPVDYRQRYVDFSRITVDSRFTGGAPQTTCPAAIGDAFAAGTEDGRGLDGFTEGDLKGNPFFNALGGIIAPAPQWVRDCQAPKPVLLATGTQQPYPWTPEVLPVSITRIGQLAIIAAPGEFTIMSGRRVRDTVRAVLGDSVKYLVFAGYANAYSGYITTPEEYDAQNYEGASTHFGRWTLPAYQQMFYELASALRQGQPAYPSAVPRDLSGKQMSFQTGVVLDNVPLWKSFGDVELQPNASYARGQRVSVEFWTGHPKNNLHQNGTFLEVQRWDGSSWRTVAVDGDWSTIYHWVRVDPVWGSSKAAISWDIPADALTGQYRIVHYGDYKNGWNGQIYSFTGTSRSFQVN